MVIKLNVQNSLRKNVFFYWYVYLHIVKQQ